MHVLQPSRDISSVKSMWTVVTGCTDGIGRAYIDELASSRGIRKFYLIARSKDKLERVKQELEESYNAEVRTCVFDFEKDDLQNLPSELTELEIGILVNCAGIAPHLVANLIELPNGLPSKILRVNLLPTVKLIEMILPGMIKRDKGFVVNVSSMTCWRPLPYMSTYPASKAAISFFSAALFDEFKHTNVHVQCLIPLLVATKVASYGVDDECTCLVISAKNYAKQAVRLIGNYSIATGCMLHDFEIAFGTLLGFSQFKTIFVPFGMLGIHKKRVAEYAKRMKIDG